MNHHRSQIENYKIKNITYPVNLNLFHINQIAQSISILYKLITNNLKIKMTMANSMIHKYTTETSMLWLRCLNMGRITSKDR